MSIFFMALSPVLSPTFVVNNTQVNQEEEGGECKTDYLSGKSKTEAILVRGVWHQDYPKKWSACGEDQIQEPLEQEGGQVSWCPLTHGFVFCGMLAFVN